MPQGNGCSKKPGQNTALARRQGSILTVTYCRPVTCACEITGLKANAILEDFGDFQKTGDKRGTLRNAAWLETEVLRSCWFQLTFTDTSLPVISMCPPWLSRALGTMETVAFPFFLA